MVHVVTGLFFVLVIVMAMMLYQVVQHQRKKNDKLIVSSVSERHEAKATALAMIALSLFIVIYVLGLFVK